MTIDKETGLTFSHYKLPLKKNVGGFGYMGAILGTMDGEKIQCHVCGLLYRDVGFHARQAHKLPVIEYKEKYNLAKNSVLISEAEREARKMRSYEWYYKLSQAQKDEISRKQKQAWNKCLETKNKKGTCPDQLLEKIKEVAEKMGKTPTKREFIEETGGQRYYHLIRVTFGGWPQALKMLGMSQRENKGNLGKRYHLYSREELIEYLQIFWQENQKIPTGTDCRRGLLPSQDAYYRAFGSFPNARSAAGITGTPTRHGVKD